MATPTSSVPRAKAALLALCAADPTLKTVKALPGPVNPKDRVPHDFIMLGRPGDGRSASSSQTPRLGNHSRQEEYSLYLTIVVVSGGYDAVASDAKAFELFSALEVAIVADRQLNAYNGGQAIGQPFQITDWDYDLDNFPALEGGLASQLVIDLACSATLRSS